MEAEQIVETHADALKHKGGKEHQHVDDEQIFCYCRNPTHTFTIYKKPRQNYEKYLL